MTRYDVETFLLDDDRQVDAFRQWLNDKSGDGWQVVSIVPDRYRSNPRETHSPESRLLRVMVTFSRED